MLNKRKSLVAGLLLSACAGFNSAYADDREGVSVFVAPTYYMFGDNDISDTGGVAAGIGYKFSQHWGIEGTYIDLGETDLDVFAGSDLDLDIKGYRADLLYYFKETSSRALPYLAFGAGNFDVDSNLAGVGSDDQTLLNVGVGVKKYITDNLSLRGDMRALRNVDESSTDLALMLGLDYSFGKAGKSSSKASQYAAANELDADSDGDGVNDSQDRCPNTPAGETVDASGCPMDGDGDGVADRQDKCPETPAGARVDEQGCQYIIKETVSVELEVLFDTDTAMVKPQFFAEIKEVADFMTMFPSLKAVIEGHTDSRGAEDYNDRLSQRRADAVQRVLVEEYGINQDRVIAVGYGESKPRADNRGEMGWQQNRRVVAVLKTVVEKKAE